MPKISRWRPSPWLRIQAIHRIPWIFRWEMQVKHMKTDMGKTEEDGKPRKNRKLTPPVFIFLAGKSGVLLKSIHYSCFQLVEDWAFREVMSNMLKVPWLEWEMGRGGDFEPPPPSDTLWPGPEGHGTIMDDARDWSLFIGFQLIQPPRFLSDMFIYNIYIYHYFQCFSTLKWPSSGLSPKKIYDRLARPSGSCRTGQWWCNSSKKWLSQDVIRDGWDMSSWQKLQDLQGGISSSPWWPFFQGLRRDV